MILRVRPRLVVLSVCVAAAALALAATVAIALQANPSVRRPARPAGTHARWIVTLKAITRLGDAGASASLIHTAFGGGPSYVIDNSGAPYVGIPTATYGSYSAIRRAFASGALPGRYKAVIYDNEAWAETPVAEREHPAQYEHLVASLLHEHGLLYIATPAVDLVSVLNPGTPGARQLRAYLQDGIAAGAARYADVVDIQAQRAQAAPSEYASFVASAAAQARRANPRVIVLAGLRSGRWITSAELSAAYSSVRSIVDGYWLNIPGSGAQCRSCSAPDPVPALGLLKQIYGQRSSAASRNSG